MPIKVTLKNMQSSLLIVKRFGNILLNGPLDLNGGLKGAKHEMA
jgi:hypothetical protein